MSEISAQTVKELRERTGSGVAICKKALLESGGDLESAVEYLCKAGLAKLVSNAAKSTKEGRIALSVKDGYAAFVEVLCETDFVAKNDKFNEYVNELAKRVVDIPLSGSITKTVNELEESRLVELINIFGENIRINRVLRYKHDGNIGSYVHFDGKQGAMVEIVGDTDSDFPKNLAMHIVLKNPAYLSLSEVPADVLDKEKRIAAARPDLLGKPADMVEKIIDGTVSKWSKETCLLQQSWWKDEKQTVEKVLGKAKLTWFVRWRVGESSR